MAKVSLRIYNREIESLIEHGQLDEALAHCSHVLRTFPKHLETYRLLGKAYLEGKRYKEAVDIFQRVLVCVPDDFVSHVGMSIISDDQSKLDDAIWHMERAFEVQPSNAAIQGELQRLFGRRDGVEPPKIRLTRGALAHMYVQGELFSQAVSEIRAVLANDSQRTDMQVLLARAYFRGGQKNEAAEICSSLLKRFPYCLDANRIMLEIPPDPHRSDTVQVYRHRVTELDPYAAFTQDTVFHSDAITDAAVSLERFEYSSQQGQAGPAWSTAPGIGLEADVTALTRSNTQPDWLKSAAPPEPAPAAESAAVAEPATEIPDFLRQSGWGESTGAFQEVLQPSAAEPDSSAAPAVQADLPDWVKAMQPAKTGGFQAPSSGPEPAVSSETPDWLRNLGNSSQPAETASPAQSGGFSTPAAEPEPAPSGMTPDWLRDLGAPSGPVEATAPSDTSAWLRSLDKQDTPTTSFEPERSKEDGWLRTLGGDQKNDQPNVPAIETPDWVKDLGPKDTAKLASPKPLPKADLDSLRDLGLAAPVTAGPTAEEESAPPAGSAADPAAYLGALGTTEQEQDDAMAWLESLAAKHGAKAEELVTDPNARSEVAPDWVDRARAIGEMPPAAVPSVKKPEPAASSADETGTWLRNLEADDDERIATKRLQSTPPASEPDWLNTLSAGQGGPVGTPGAPGGSEGPAVPKIDTPDWLAGLDTEQGETSGMAVPVEKADGQAAPDWLGDLGLVKKDGPMADREVPDWLNSETAAPAAPAARPDITFGSASDLPDWLAGLDREEQSVPPAGNAAADAELPQWLHGDEAQPQASEPANPADWRPVASDELPNLPKPLPRQPVPREPQFPVEEPEPVRKSAPKPVKAAPVPARPKPSAPARDGEAVLTSAQQEMERGNIGAAVDIYGRLIRKGKSLEESIRDLREALYRFPVEVGIWQALGDAYMRANRLQEALDAYTKAEELLR